MNSVSSVNNGMEIDTNGKNYYCCVHFADMLLEVELLGATVGCLKASCTIQSKICVTCIFSFQDKVIYGQ